MNFFKDIIIGCGELRAVGVAVSNNGVGLGLFIIYTCVFSFRYTYSIYSVVSCSI